MPTLRITAIYYRLMSLTCSGYAGTCHPVTGESLRARPRVSASAELGDLDCRSSRNRAPRGKGTMDTAAELIRRLGVAPVVAGVHQTVAFFKNHLHVDPLNYLKYIKGIDFHNPVRQVWLPADTPLIRHQWTGTGQAHETGGREETSRPKPFGYFASPGASPTRLGTTFPATTFEAYEATRATVALESVASTLSFGLDERTRKVDRVARLGGAKQYILAERDVQELRRTR